MILPTNTRLNKIRAGSVENVFGLRSPLKRTELDVNFERGTLPGMKALALINNNKTMYFIIYQ
jgi:hypothetical protein